MQILDAAFSLKIKRNNDYVLLLWLVMWARPRRAGVMFTSNTHSRETHTILHNGSKGLKEYVTHFSFKVTVLTITLFQSEFDMKLLRSATIPICWLSVYICYMLMNFSVICSTIVHLNASFLYHLNVMPLIHARARLFCFSSVCLLCRSALQKIWSLSRGQQSTS